MICLPLSWKFPRAGKISHTALRSYWGGLHDDAEWVRGHHSTSSGLFRAKNSAERPLHSFCSRKHLTPTKTTIFMRFGDQMVPSRHRRTELAAATLSAVSILFYGLRDPRLISTMWTMHFTLVGRAYATASVSVIGCEAASCGGQDATPQGDRVPLETSSSSERNLVYRVLQHGVELHVSCWVSQPTAIRRKNIIAIALKISTRHQASMRTTDLFVWL